MDGLLAFDNAVENGIDWLESAQSWLSSENEETGGQWKEAASALEKLNAAMALLREVRTPLQNEIKALWDENNRFAE